MRQNRKFLLWIKKGIALFLFFAAVLGGLYFPVWKMGLSTGVAIYALFLWRFNFFALFFIPAVLPLLNLAPWSGIVLFEEFDLFLLATVAVSVWKGHYSKNVFSSMDKLSWVCVILFLISIMVSLFKGMLPLSPLQPNDLSNYLSHFNSLRIGRSFLWTILLMPAINFCFLKDKEAATKHIMTGFMFGVIGVCIIVFWERGVINDLLNATNRYELLRNLLDFSSEYRITALFSEMNTGGTAIDGYIALSWVFPLGAYFIWIETSKKMEWTFSHLIKGFLAVLALGSGLYIIATTFTRITYAALGISFLIIIFSVSIGNYRKNRDKTLFFYLILFLLLLFFIGLLVYLFQKGGYLSLFSGIFIIFGGSLIGILSLRFGKILFLLSGLFVFFCGFGLMTKGMITSKWVETGFFEAVVISFVGSWMIFSICTGLGRIIANKKKVVEFIGVFIPLVVVFGISIPMVFGNRMQVRFSTATEDGSGRIYHWQNVLNAMDDDISTIVTGMGVGSFPRYFFQKDKYSRELGSYSYRDEYGNGFLRLSGGKDMELGQRFFLSEDENQKYILNLKVRTNQKDSILSLRICHRNLLHAAGCKYYQIKLDNEYRGQWKPYQLVIEKNIIQKSDWYSNWPQVFLVRNAKNGTDIDIDDVSLINESGKNIIKNGDYEKGGQRWFSYNEFEHLAWHTKNIVLHFFFEQGVLGVIGILVLTAVASWKNFQGVLQGQIFPTVLLAAIIGFQVIGLTDTPIDAPRVAFIYYMIIMMSFIHISCEQSSTVG